MDVTPHFPIYLDYGATTPVDPRVVDAHDSLVARARSATRRRAAMHWGWEAEEAVEEGAAATWPS